MASCPGSYELETADLIKALLLALSGEMICEVQFMSHFFNSLCHAVDGIVVWGDLCLLG